jgi:fructose-1,6-bisphosphatase
VAKIEIMTAEPERVLPVLRDAIERQRRLLSQSLVRTEEKIQQLAAHLHVNADLLLAGEIPHSEEQDMDLLELEGELELRRHLQEQLESLDRLTLCP